MSEEIQNEKSPVSEAVTEAMDTQPPGKKPGKRRNRIIILVFLLVWILLLFYFFVIKQPPKKNALGQVPGERIEVDDFYHATDGIWEMETTIHILKSQKFVSSENELKQFLVRTVKPGETVQISQAAGRWKKLAILENGKFVPLGWADAEDGRAKKQIKKKLTK